MSVALRIHFQLKRAAMGKMKHYSQNNHDASQSFVYGQFNRIVSKRQNFELIDASRHYVPLYRQGERNRFM